MSIPEWPSSLPQWPLRDGFIESIPNQTLRFKFDEGPAKVRRLGAPLPIPLTIPINLTNAQRTTFKTFVDTTLDGGTLRFQYTHPIDNTSIEVRIVPASSEELYNLQPSGFGWFLQLQLEILP